MKNVILLIDLTNLAKNPSTINGIDNIYACLVGGWRIGTIYYNWVEAK